MFALFLKCETVFVNCFFCRHAYGVLRVNSFGVNVNDSGCREKYTHYHNFFAEIGKIYYNHRLKWSKMCNLHATPVIVGQKSGLADPFDLNSVGRGRALFPLTALISHSCRPNLIHRKVFQI